MKSFFRLMSLTVQGRMYYRTSFILNLITPLLLLVGQFLLWRSLYDIRGGGAWGDYSRKDMFSYILIAFCVSNLLTWTSENNLSREIRTGEIVARCIRPFPFLGQSVADMTGSLLIQGAVNFSVIAAVFVAFQEHLTIPKASSLLLFAISLVFAVILRVMLVSTFSLLCFFTTGHLGLTWTRTALTEFFSGALIPVSLFPGWLRTVSFATPFPFMLQIPLSLFLDKPLPMSLPMAFGVQIFWMIVLTLLHGVLYGRIRKNLTIAGG